MNKRLMLSLVTLVCMLSAVRATAQEHGQVGLTFGSPAAVGLVFHVTDTVAIRPDFSFTRNSLSSTSTSTLGSVVRSTTTSTTPSIGVSALFYTGRWENLRAYVSPRFAYSRARSTYTTDSPLVISTTNSSGSSSYLFVGSLGMQYSLGRRFGVFGELGFAYNRQTAAPSTTSSSTGNLYSVRSGVGGIFYFK